MTNKFLETILNGFFINIDNQDIKDNIKQRQAIQTGVAVDMKLPDLSKNANRALANAFTIDDGGPDSSDCLFTAVCKSLNFYNMKNQRDNVTQEVRPGVNEKVRFIYEDRDGVKYGVTTVFTVTFLREKVYRFMEDKNNADPDYYANLDRLAKENSRDFFMEYTDKLNGEGIDLSSSTAIAPNVKTRCLQIAQDLYDNFFIDKPTIFTVRPSVASFDPTNPLKIIDTNKGELYKYITSSDYWGDFTAIVALNDVLNLNIICVTGIQRKYEIPRPKKTLNYLVPKIIDGNYNSDRNPHYLFLYKTNIRYNLIFFKTKLNVLTLFEYNLRATAQLPLYMFFFIFIDNYLGLTAMERPLFKFYPLIFTALFNSFSKIATCAVRTASVPNCSNQKIKESEEIIKECHKWFPVQLVEDYYDQIQAKSISGGAPSNKTRKNKSKYYYSNSNRPNYFLKRDDIKDVSKLGYYISIDLELKKGSPLTPEEINQSQCTRKWNTVRKAYADFTGKKYVIPPVYDYSNKQTLKNRSNTIPSNTPPNAAPAPTPAPAANPSGGTRKNNGIKKIYLNKHSKTRKKD